MPSDSIMAENDELDFVTFTIIIDDIVHPDGRTVMESLGGGGPQTAFGARLWCSTENIRVGLAASVGLEFPVSCRKWLDDMQIDTAGLILSSSPTLRAWQILEADGRRTQVWRVDVGDEVWNLLRPSISSLPLQYQKAKVYHVGIHPSTLDLSFVESLRATGAELISVETYTHSEVILTRSELAALVTSAHVFSPNEKEAISLVGPGTPLEIISRLVELGAQIITLRRGSSGCIVHRTDNRETWEIPAFHALRTVSSEIDGRCIAYRPVIDPTGCGNAFCGGFAIGWWKTRNLRMAGLYGSASASFMIEYEGVPPPPISRWSSELEWRIQVLQQHARRLDFP